LGDHLPADDASLGATDGEPYAGMALTRTGLRSLVPALTVCMIVAAYRLRRRDERARSVVAAAAVIAVITLVVSLSARAAESHISIALEMAAYGTQAANAPFAVHWPPLPWRMLTAAVSVIPFAWLGVVLARRRGWPLTVISTTMLCTWVFANLAGLYLLDLVLRSTPAWRPILEPLVIGTYAIPPNLLTLVALILMWRGVETGFDRFTSAGTR
jgi:hypothetical protein